MLRRTGKQGFTSGGLQGPIWYFSAHLFFLASINVITKTYHFNSYNGPNSIILVYSNGEALPSGPLQLRLFFSLLHFSLLTTDCSQPLTSFNFLWIFRSYSLWFLLWFFHYLIFSAILFYAYKFFQAVNHLST